MRDRERKVIWTWHSPKAILGQSNGYLFHGGSHSVGGVGQLNGHLGEISTMCSAQDLRLLLQGLLHTHHVVLDIVKVEKHIFLEQDTLEFLAPGLQHFEDVHFVGDQLQENGHIPSGMANSAAKYSNEIS